MSGLATQKNFQVALPEKVYRELRAEAERANQPAPALVRLAIEAWLEKRREEALDAEITAYAERHAGTEVDLDKELEAAGIEFLLSQDKQASTRKQRKVKAR